MLPVGTYSRVPDSTHGEYKSGHTRLVGILNLQLTESPVVHVDRERVLS